MCITDSNAEDRFQIGRGTDRWMIIDCHTGWVKTWFSSRREAEIARLRLELGLDEPPGVTIE